MSYSKRLFVALIFAFFYNWALAEPPAAISEKLESEYSKILNPLVEKKLIPGYYFALYQAGEKIFEKAEGVADDLSGLEPSEQTLFAIASMTKPITTLGILHLIEQSEMKLLDPVSKYLPEFSQMLVAPGGSYDSQLQPAGREITIFDLLTHTSGMTYTSGITGVGDIADAYRDLEIFTLEAKVSSSSGDLAGHTRKLAELPLVSQPGEKFIYSVGVDVAGRIIEVASGLSLRDYLRENILLPLGMTDTDFIINPKDIDRLARLYSPLTRTYQIPGVPKMYQQTNLIPNRLKNFGIEAQMYSGGAGLISTSSDYAKLLKFLLQRSEDNLLGLSQKTFDLMLTDQLGDFLGQNLMVEVMGATATDQVFSVGLGISLEDGELDPNKKPYDYLYWAGAYNTQFWIDQRSQVFGIFMSQIFPPMFRLTPELEEVADAVLSSNAP